MKEATGELNMTLVTIIAIAFIAGVVAIFAPKIMDQITGKWNEAGKEDAYKPGDYDYNPNKQ